MKQSTIYFSFAFGSKRHGEEICFLLRLSKFQGEEYWAYLKLFSGLSNFGIVKVVKMKATLHFTVLNISFLTYCIISNLVSDIFTKSFTLNYALCFFFPIEKQVSVWLFFFFYSRRICTRLSFRQCCSSPEILNFILERSVVSYIILNVCISSFSKHINCNAVGNLSREGNINFAAILRICVEHNIVWRPCDLILNYEMLI